MGSNLGLIRSSSRIWVVAGVRYVTFYLYLLGRGRWKRGKGGYGSEDW